MAKPIINADVIKQRGKAIICEVNQDEMFERSTQDLKSKHLVKLVTSKGGGLTQFEKGVLLQYVRDGVINHEDPDRRLDNFICTEVEPMANSEIVGYTSDYGQRRAIWTCAGLATTLIFIGLADVVIELHRGWTNNSWVVPAGFAGVGLLFLWAATSPAKKSTVAPPQLVITAVVGSLMFLSVTGGCLLQIPSVPPFVWACFAFLVVGTTPVVGRILSNRRHR